MNLRCVLSSSAPLLPLVPRPKKFQASGRGSNSRRPRRARWILADLRPCRSCQALSSLVNVVPCPVVPSSRLPGKRQIASLLQPVPGWDSEAHSWPGQCRGKVWPCGETRSRGVEAVVDHGPRLHKSRPRSQSGLRTTWGEIWWRGGNEKSSNQGSGLVTAGRELGPTAGMRCVRELGREGRDALESEKTLEGAWKVFPCERPM